MKFISKGSLNISILFCLTNDARDRYYSEDKFVQHYSKFHLDLKLFEL
jgi:hypothetical protein